MLTTAVQNKQRVRIVSKFKRSSIYKSLAISWKKCV